MYIAKENGKFIFSETSDNAVIKISDPEVTENGIKSRADFSHKSGGIYFFSNEKNCIGLSVKQVNDCCFKIKQSVQNTSESTESIQLSFSVAPLFHVDKYLIPCVSFGGNVFGSGKEPKGLTCNGESWFFSYDRTSIPACTLTENSEISCALFSSAEDNASLQSSCSIATDGDGYRQYIIHPVEELPLTYTDRDEYSEPMDNTIALNPGERFECYMYLIVSKPKWKNYGICETLDRYLELPDSNIENNEICDSELWKNSISFAKSLITDYKGKKGFIIGFLPNEKGGFEHRKDNCFELAWCGQNILLSRMFIDDFRFFGNKESLNTALEILDTRVECCVAENGLFSSQLSHFENLTDHSADTCNMGYGVYELLRCYETLKEIGIVKERYFEAAKKFCDFFCAHFSEEYGFGKQWMLSGNCIDKSGSVGAFIICPLAEIYRMTGEEKYLAAADKALRFYTSRDLNEFCCTAGALDTCCVDKETSVPFLISSLILFEVTGKHEYLEFAEKAAYYFTSWMFHYQPVYSNDTDIGRYKICVKGLTAVSTQHHHLDPYAALVVPYFKRLAKYTGDGRWTLRSEMMWKASVQTVGNGSLKIHGVVRPVGSQNEAVCQCHWGPQGVKSRGNINDWLVAWPCAFRLSVLSDKISTECKIGKNG